MIQEKQSNTPEYFRDQFEIQRAIEDAGLVTVSDVEITDSDIVFFKDREIKFDSVNNVLVLRVGDTLKRFKALE